MDGLRRVDPLLIEAELLHAGLCLGLMCFKLYTKGAKMRGSQIYGLQFHPKGGALKSKDLNFIQTASDF
jgi:hypothetical protein